MTKLQRLYEEQGQSPRLDNLTRPYLRDGTLARYVADGVRGVTANPTIFVKAIEGSDAYDSRFRALIVEGCTVGEACWRLVIDDVVEALALLRPTFGASAGTDGFASIEVDPDLARDTDGTIAAARYLHERIDQPNLFVKGGPIRTSEPSRRSGAASIPNWPTIGARIMYSRLPPTGTSRIGPAASFRPP